MALDLPHEKLDQLDHDDFLILFDSSDSGFPVTTGLGWTAEVGSQHRPGLSIVLVPLYRWMLHYEQQQCG